MQRIENTVRNVCTLLGQNADDPDFAMILCVKDNSESRTVIHGTRTDGIMCCLAALISEYVQVSRGSMGFDMALDEFFNKAHYVFSVKDEFYEGPERVHSLNGYRTGDKNYSFSSCFVNRYSTKYKSCRKKKLDEAMFETLSDHVNEKILECVNDPDNRRCDAIVSYNYAGLGSTLLNIDGKGKIPEVITSPFRAIYKSALDEEGNQLPYEYLAGCLQELIKNLRTRMEE